MLFNYLTDNGAAKRTNATKLANTGRHPKKCLVANDGESMVFKSGVAAAKYLGIACSTLTVAIQDSQPVKGHTVRYI